MNRQELAQAIYETSHLTGRFVLRSGMVSNEYFDKYLFESDPILLDAIAEHLSQKIPKETEILAGLEMGGIPIVTALSLKTGIPAVFVRKQAKKYGTGKLAEGIDLKGKKVCILEDVVTTGGQIILSANELKKEGALLIDVICVILRAETVKDKLKKIGLHITPLFEMAELTIYASKSPNFEIQN